MPLSTDRMASLRALGLACVLLLSRAAAQLPSDSTDGLTFLTGTKTQSTSERATPTGTYQTFSSKITLASTALSSGLGSIAPNATTTGTEATTDSTTVLTGSARSSSSTTLTGNFSSTATTTSSTAPEPTNTTPCNNYPEFCARRYSNITMVGCHNSPFVRAGSAAANQEYNVTAQLDDGIRFLQAQIQWPAGGTEPHFCHTSCDILDAGPMTDWLGQVNRWVSSHPYDVVTILLGNGNYSTPDLYVPYIERTGILQWTYTPPVIPMNLTDWPTLSSMILAGKRVVMMLDYMANQTAYPWLLDEFSTMWETPFDPLDRTFPCVVQRPPGLSPDDARRRMYLANHNLNAEVSLLGTSILVPAVSLLNETNNATGFGSLGEAALRCERMWGRAPNVLNVDYYNYGGFPGSVFEVAARMNNVTYDRPCCGGVRSAAPGRMRMELGRLAVGLGVVWGVALLLG